MAFTKMLISALVAVCVSPSGAERARAVYPRNGFLNSAGTEEPFTTPATTVSPEVEEECQDTFMHFVNREHMCDPPHTGTHKPSQAFNSCAHRCGLRKEHEDGTYFNCACDDKCVIYKDCCVDMRSQCPDIYAKGNETFGALAQMDITCRDSVLTIRGKSLPNTDTMTIDRFNFLNRRFMNLGTLFEEFDTMLVANTNLGLIFDGYKSADHIGRLSDTQRWEFVPRELTLACIKTNLGPLPFRNVLRILVGCMPTAVRDVHTVFPRRCGMKWTVSCNCGDQARAIKKEIKDVCSSRNRSTSHTQRYEHIDIDDMQSTVVPEEDHGVCTYGYSPIQSLTSDVVEVDAPAVWSPMTGIIGRQQATVAVTLTPVVMSDGADTSIPRDDGLESLQDRPALELEFVAEFDGMVEKRIRCSSFRTSIDNCRLEDCRPGAVLMANVTSPWAFNGQACILPIKATVQASENSEEITGCWCSDVTAALASLQVWKVSVKLFGQSRCTFILDVLQLGKWPLKRGC